MQEASPTMLSLPAELIHRVLEDLDKHDVLSVRRACSFLAKIGKEYTLLSIVAIYKRDSLDRILEASKHAYFSTRVKTLHFQADKFGKKLSYRKWKQNVERDLDGRRQMKAMSAYMSEHPYRPWDDDKIQATSKAMKEISPISGGELRGRDHKPSYNAYSKFLADQDAIDEEDLVGENFTRLFERCPELDQVALRTGPGPKKHFEVARKAFKEGLETPGVDDSAKEGVDPWICLIDALSVSKKALKSFTVCPTSFNILTGLNSRPTMAEIMSSLEAFKSAIDCFFDEHVHDEEAFEDIEEEARELFRKGELVHWLSAAKGLRTLKLRMPAFDLSHSIWVDLGDIIGDTKWEHLSDLTISTVEMTEDYLVNLLLRHKSSLRQLNLAYIDLISGTWDSVFTRLSSQLTELRHVVLHGLFKRFGDPVYHFSTVGPEGDKIDAFRDHIEDRLLNGGRIHLPSSDDEEEVAQYDTVLKNGHDGKLYSEVPGYVPPRKKGLSEDRENDIWEDDEDFDCY